MEQVLVSIYVPTFNHENYIARALDSIFMQKTRYAYEVLVGEDCSTDNTRQVLKEWEAAHPDHGFQIFYRETNMHKSACNNARDLKNRCKGKYIIGLEGDDFWTDPLKLEKQVTFLEENPDYYAVAHNCTVVGADSLPNGEDYPQCKDPEYTFDHFARDILPGQLTTLLARNYMTDPTFDRSLMEKRVQAGDRNNVFSILCQGRICCIQESMSAYRHITEGGSSFSANHRYSYAQEEMANRYRMEFAHKMHHPQAIACSEYLYLRNIRYALRTKRISAGQAWKDMKNISQKTKAIMRLLKRDINRHILRDHQE